MNQRPAPTTFRRATQEAGPNGLTPAGLKAETVLSRRRFLVLALNLVTLALLLAGLARVLGAGGWSVVDVAIFIAFLFGAPWTVLGFWNAAIGFIVREGEAELGKLRNATYFVHPTTPGQHSYVVHSEAKDVMNIEVEAGETYYVSGSLSMGVFAGRPNLSPSSQDAFVAAQKKLKPAKPLKQKD